MQPNTFTYNKHLTSMTALSVHHAYTQVLTALELYGQDITVKNDVHTKNLHNVNILLEPEYTVEHPHGMFNRRLFSLSRNLTNKVQNAEFAWYMTGNPAVDCITKYIKNWQRFSDDGINVNSNYGAIWNHQIYGVLNKLTEDKYTRQAAIQIYDGAMASNFNTKDVQCTLAISFDILPDNGKDYLHMSVYMRSNDAIYGLPIDMFCFSSLHELVANELRQSVYPDLMLGTYKHESASLHIYESSYKLLTTNNVDDINVSKYETCSHSSFAPTTTLTNFWVVKDDYILDNLDYEHFMQYVNPTVNNFLTNFYEFEKIYNVVQPNEYSDAHKLVSNTCMLINEYAKQLQESSDIIVNNAAYSNNEVNFDYVSNVVEHIRAFKPQGLISVVSDILLATILYHAKSESDAVTEINNALSTVNHVVYADEIVIVNGLNQFDYLTALIKTQK